MEHRGLALHHAANGLGGAEQACGEAAGKHAAQPDSGLGAEGKGNARLVAGKTGADDC